MSLNSSSSFNFHTSTRTSSFRLAFLALATLGTQARKVKKEPRVLLRKQIPRKGTTIPLLHNLLNSSDATVEAKKLNRPEKRNRKAVACVLSLLVVCFKSVKMPPSNAPAFPQCFSFCHVISRRAVSGQLGSCRSAAAKNFQPGGTMPLCRCGWPDRRDGRNRAALGPKSLHG
uniref:Uncharacterized protein n=1 Tax=Ixodes ricinus TaxID=34613 RepID=A0A147BD62_IXORI